MVVGAGPAGLMAAARAASAGHSVIVLEASEVVGGMAGSFEVAGMRVDFGSHRLHPATPPELLAEIRHLLGDDLQTRPRRGRIRLADRWLGFPLQAADLLRSLPRGMAVRAARDAAVAPLRRPRADTFAEVVRAGLGPTVAGAFYEPYARKLWGREPSELAGELARRRVSAGSPTAIAARLVRGARPEGRVFLYPRRGFGQIAEALAEEAVAAGVTLRTGVPVTGLAVGGEDVTVTTPSGQVRAGLVWSTAPVPLLAGLVDPPVPAGVRAALGRLEHRGMALVYLVVEGGPWTAFDAHYFPDDRELLSRLSEPRNYRDSADDPTEVTVLCAEVPCAVGDAHWSASDDALGAAVVESLARQGLPPVRPVAVTVRRLPCVYPVPTATTAHDLAVAEAWLAATPRIVSLGRQGLFVPDNTHHVLAMGAAAAAALGPDGTFDHRAWNVARHGFRAHVVED